MAQRLLTRFKEPLAEEEMAALGLGQQEPVAPYTLEDLLREASAMTQGEQKTPAPPSLLPVQFPDPKDYAPEEMPEERFGWKEALMGLIPGYSQGKAGRREMVRSEVQQRNLAKQRMFGELMDRAIAEQRERRTERHNLAMEDYYRGESERRRDADVMRNEVGKQRADAYERSISDLSRYRGSALDLRLRELEQEIGRDQSVSDYRKVLLTLRAREEAGRAQRHADTLRSIEGRQENAIEAARRRMEYIQGQINQRQQNLLEQKKLTPAQVSAAYDRAARTARYVEDWDTLTPEEQVDILNNLAESYATNQMPQVETQPAQAGTFRSLMESWGLASPKITVKPPPPVAAPQPGASPAAPAQPTGNVRRQGNGRTAPDWLVKQYIEQARREGGDATEWLKVDGWK